MEIMNKVMYFFGFVLMVSGLVAAWLLSITVGLVLVVIGLLILTNTQLISISSRLNGEQKEPQPKPKPKPRMIPVNQPEILEEPIVVREAPPGPSQEELDAIEVKKLAEEAIRKAEEQLKEEIFKCKKCQKEFADKKKLQRHIGMAHYMDLSI